MIIIVRVHGMLLGLVQKIVRAHAIIIHGLDYPVRICIITRGL